ncbi:MAG: hypothetical protein OHK0029_31750 [Armatimonadaceae bacterium]
MLIGQRFTGQLYTGNYQQVAGSHLWSGPGQNDCFQSYANGQVALGMGNITQYTVSFNWLVDNTYQVICTANVLNPLGGTLSVTGRKTIVVEVPYYYYGNVTGTTAYLKNGILNGPANNPTDIQAGQDANTAPGMTFKAAVGTPDRYRNTLGTGSFKFVQLVHFVKHGWWWSSPIPVGFTTDGEFKLDNGDPYAGPFPADAVESVPPSSGPNLQFVYQTEDSPTFGNMKDWWRVFIDFDARMYLMYLPPGSGSQWVPLHRHDWFWDVDISRPIVNGTWPSNGGSISTGFNARWYSHPTWDNTHTNTP